MSGSGLPAGAQRFGAWRLAWALKGRDVWDFGKVSRILPQWNNAPPPPPPQKTILQT